MRQFFTLWLLLFSATTFAQTYLPLNNYINSGWNRDVIAEGSSPRDANGFRASIATNAAVSNTDAIYYGDALNAQSFSGYWGTPTSYYLPSSGSVTNSGLSGCTFQLQPYDQNNALFVPAGNTINMSFQANSSIRADELVFLVTQYNAYYNYPFLACPGQFKVNFSDGTSETFSVQIGGFFYNNASTIAATAGRVRRALSSTDWFWQNSNSVFLHYVRITLSETNKIKKISSVDFTSVNDGVNNYYPDYCILAANYKPFACANGGTLQTYYEDADGDGYGNPLVSVDACTQPQGYVLNNTDNCPYTYNPDQKDSNKDGIGDACENSISINPQSWITLCQTAGFAFSYTATGQYNSGNIFTAQLSDSSGNFDSPINIGAVTSTTSGNIQCDLNYPPPGTHYRLRVVASDPATVGTDNGTDLVIKENVIYYRDADGDGFGNPNMMIENCLPLVGWVTNNTDCDDNDNTVYPGAPELCDGKDNNCNGQIDETTLEISAVADSSILCNGGGTTVTVSGNGGQMPYTGTGVFSAFAGSNEYAITDAYGCTVGTIVNLTEPDSLVASANANPITCIGGTTILHVSATGGTLPYDGVGDFTISAGPYNYTVTDFNGCSDYVSNVIPDGTGTAPATPKKIKGDQYNVCGDADHVYTVSTVSGATVYNWIVPSPLTLVTTSANTATIHIPSTFTNYADIGVQAQNDCGTSGTRSLRVFAVAPNPSSYISGPTSVTAGQTGVIYSLPSLAGIVYTWEVPSDATIVSGQGGNKIKVNWGSTSGPVKVTVSNACGSSPTGKLNVTVVATIAAGKAAYLAPLIRVYPNPARNVAQLEFTSTKSNTEYEIRVADVSGKALLVYKGITITGVNTVPLQVSSFANGTYMVTLITEDNSTTIKLLKQK